MFTPGIYYDNSSDKKQSKSFFEKVIIASMNEKIKVGSDIKTQYDHYKKEHDVFKKVMKTIK